MHLHFNRVGFEWSDHQSTDQYACNDQLVLHAMGISTVGECKRACLKILLERIQAMDEASLNVGKKFGQRGIKDQDEIWCFV